MSQRFFIFRPFAFSFSDSLPDFAGGVSIIIARLCGVRPAAVSQEEQRKIEGLIRHAEGMTDAQFVRNGRAYSSKTAAWFLKKKWEANCDKVQTSKEFVARVATRSSTTGVIYTIRLKDGTTVPCGDYLNGVLERGATGMN
jgi:hypothetical protein